jgi:Zinc carboxypeptidase
MFTRVVVLFSLFVVILGIWFTLPELSISTKQAVQFSSIGELDSNLAVYQKKTRKHTYDQSFDTVPKLIQDQFTAPKIPEIAEKIVLDTENQNKYTVEPIFVDTQILKKEIASKNPNLAKDYYGRENLIPKIAYKSSSLIQATKSSFGNMPESSSFQDPEVLEGFVDSSIKNDVTGVKIDQPFTVTFDSLPSASVLDSLKFSPEVKFTKTLNQNTLTVSPVGMNRGTKYIFGLPDKTECKVNLFNQCQQNLNWLYALSFQTDYKQTLVYGQSEEGRDLVSNIYGYCNDPISCKIIMLTSGIHGSEWQSGDLVKLQNFIEQNPAQIINKNKVIIIVPQVNPDGAAVDKRYNANEINLNRNFPTDFVACDICGTVALSEKESKYLVDFTLKQKPSVLISYHSQWPPDGMIFRGDDKNQKTLEFAKWVSQRTGYPVGEFPDAASVPGDQTVWAESQGINSLLIETKLVTDSDWDKNFNLYLSLLSDY